MSDIYLSLTETPSVVTLSQPVISGALAATVTVGNTVTVALDANSLSALENVTVTVGSSVALAAGSAQIGSVTVANFPANQTVAGTVTVGSLPDGVSFGQQLAEGYDNYGGAPVQIVGSSITQSISGTVTANVYVAGYDQYYEEKTELPVISFNQPINTAASDKTIPVQIANDSGTLNSTNPLPISGAVTANGGDFSSSTTMPPHKAVNLGFTNGDGEFLQVGDQYPLPVAVAYSFVTQTVAGTVTANNPSGALTTRFGSVATANLAFITSAVTNTSRKYLLAQNISAGTVTIGIGFSPTTTQGIQLTAGAGLTFDSFCPTGAVYWLGAVTGAAFTILEG